MKIDTKFSCGDEVFAIVSYEEKHVKKQKKIRGRVAGIIISTLIFKGEVSTSIRYNVGDLDDSYYDEFDKETKFEEYFMDEDVVFASEEELNEFSDNFNYELTNRNENICQNKNK